MYKINIFCQVLENGNLFGDFSFLFVGGRFPSHLKKLGSVSR